MWATTCSVSYTHLVSAIDYLVKPVETERLAQAIARVREQVALHLQAHKSAVSYTHLDVYKRQNVDTVTGATLTSMAIIESVADCVNQEIGRAHV